jgi:integrase/recombinase XerC
MATSRIITPTPTQQTQQALVTVSPGKLATIAGPSRLVDVFLSGKSKTTLLAYRADLEAFSRFLGKSTIDEAADAFLGYGHGMANQVALSYRAQMLESGLAPATCNRRLAAVRSLVKLARVIGRVTWVLEIPAVRSEKYRDTKGPGLQGFRAIFDNASQQKGVMAIRNKAILRVLWSQGLRRAELVSLDLANFDQQGKRLSILGKGRRERKWVELPAQTMQAIQDWLLIRGPHEGPLFTNLDRRTKRARLTGAGLYKIVRSLGEDVGIKTRPHGIRHATITQRIASGMTLPEVQDFSRHSDIKTLMIYNDRLENAAGRLAAMADSEI